MLLTPGCCPIRVQYVLSSPHLHMGKRSVRVPGGPCSGRPLQSQRKDVRLAFPGSKAGPFPATPQDPRKASGPGTVVQACTPSHSGVLCPRPSDRPLPARSPVIIPPPS